MAEDRVKRLRRAVLAVPPEQLRAASSRISEEMIRALPGPARPVANQLRRSSDPAALLRRLPNLTVLALVADVLTDECLDATREALGDAADDPSMNQLQGALDTVLEDHDPALVRVMLAVVAEAEAEAADKCDELLTTDERFALPEEDEAADAARPAARSGPSEEVLAKRRERKEAEKARRAAQRERANRPKAKKKGSAAPAPAEEPPAPAAPPVAPRRQPANVPAGFDADHPLVGSVVLADVPFDAGIGGKTRPAVVVAVGDDELLVRAAYSEGGMHSRTWQAHEVTDLAAAGLTKPTWIEPDARAIPADVGDAIGRLSDDDWNALW